MMKVGEVKMKRKVNVIEDLDGKKTVFIHDILFKGKRAVKWDEVEKYLRQYVGDICTIDDSNEVIYIGADLPDEYAHAVIAKWRGAKKNDIIVFLGLNSSTNTVQWAYASTFGNGVGNELLQTKVLSTAISEKMDLSLLQKVYKVSMQSYHRYSMEKFAYLLGGIQYPWYLYLLVFIFSTAASIGIVILLYKHDLYSTLFNRNKRYNQYQYNRYRR